MANSEETLGQAIGRISRCLQSELCDGMSLAQEARAVEAAIRQGIAWAYRDAAKYLSEQSDGVWANTCPYQLERKAEEEGEKE